MKNKKNHLWVIQPLTLRITLSVLFLLFSTSAFAKGLSVTPFYGYQFGGNLRVHNGELQIKDTENQGIAVNLAKTYNTTLQFLYINQDTSVQFKDNFLGKTYDLFDMSIEYYQIGGTRETSKGNSNAFVSGSFGATEFTPKVGGYSSETLFSMTFGMGIGKEIKKNMSLLVQARFLIPIQTAGGGLFCGGGGCSVQVSGGSNILQADVTAGLQFKFD